MTCNVFGGTLNPTLPLQLIRYTCYQMTVKHIVSRAEMTKKVIMDMKKLFTGKLTLELNKRILKCLVCSVKLY